jgi:hypothetical protein
MRYAGWLSFWLSSPENQKLKDTMTYHNSDQSDRDASRLNTLLPALAHSPQRGKSRVQIIAIGAAEDVLQLMYRLHRCGLEVPQWSPPQPIPETEEVVRVYIQNSGIQNS